MSTTITAYFQGVGMIPENETEVTMILPPYDSTLTMLIQITPIYNGSFRILNVSKITNNSFTVYGPPPSVYFPVGPGGEFNWVAYGQTNAVANVS